MFSSLKFGGQQICQLVKTSDRCVYSIASLHSNNFHFNAHRTTTEKSLPRRLNLYKSGDSVLKENLSSSLLRRNLASVTPAAIGKAVSKDERREFMAVFPDIVRDLTETHRQTEIPDVTKWYSKVLQYNVPGGKKNRGLALILAYRMLAPQSAQTPEKIREAQIMGWCIEMLQAFFLVLDDMIDGSETRRGRICWYRNPSVGLNAANDGIFIESGIYQLLRRYFVDKPYYFQAIDLFHDATHKTIMGQALDLLTAQSIAKYKLDKFTMDRYNSIVKYKTSYYSFHLPVALAMYMAGISNAEQHRQAKILLLEMGNFFQVQDDYMDCFGDPAVTGKIGTDIQDGKCSWLAVVALQRCTPDQRKILEECYGSHDPEKVDAVRNVYNQINLPHIFTTYEEDSYNLIQTHIQQMSGGLNLNLFFKLLDKIYKRDN
ncbi:farnesyl pyrophosphate synthase-like isoform X2 [Homalodisca vitripennis]|uniref:farnesyl pyrophosphate synthase-like isoform X2 n=1 Tax=Homalodisca vitripennis TaxID=197043 RepID=UPI001EEC330E|nr:farnesyl pyrophosphate synthase-like isoform X2 [Homalodisca vitripennis]